MSKVSMWKCPKCGRVGSLCERVSGTTIYRSVERVDSSIIPHVGPRMFIGGKRDGYVCYHCDAKIADTPEELKAIFEG